MNVRATATFTPRSDLGQFIATKVTPAVRAACQAAGEKVLSEAKAIVPVKTGELRDSGKVVMRDGEKSVIADVVFTAPHAAYVEYGTGRRGATSAGAGPYPYSPTWPGMAAQPYLRPALDSSRGAILEEFSLMVRE